MENIILKRNFVIIITFCLLQFIHITLFAVEPGEILQNQKQELRARTISKNIFKPFLKIV